MNKLAAVVVLVGTTACIDVAVDDNETANPLPGQPTVEFSPSESVIPFPNNLVRSPASGKVALPMACNESPGQTAVRLVLNQLNGFGTYQPALQFTTTEALDPASIAASVSLVRRATGTATVDPATATPVPVFAFVSMTARSSADCATTKAINSVVLVPLQPLVQTSTYDVVIKRGIKTAAGLEFGPSSTWALVRQATNPVTVEAGAVVSERTPLDGNDPDDVKTLLGLDLLWKAHAQALAFTTTALKVNRDDIVLAWEFTTQTTTAALDPRDSNTIAGKLPETPLVGIQSITGGNTAAFMNGALGASNCQLLGCAAVGDVLGAGLIAPNYQQATPNPLSGGATIPGPWSDPLAPTKVGDNTITALIFVPATAAPPAGYPTIIFGHGLGQDRTNLFAVASQLAGVGFASIAIDFVAHGSRAVLASNSAALGCSGTPTPKAQPQCFAPFLSANLAGTRDNIRQTVLDLLRLGKALKACGTTNCGALKVNGARIGYAGLSLGGIIGSMASSMSTDIKAAALSVPGGGWIDILENTATLDIRCSLVNSLIDAGVLMGDKWNPQAGTGLCTTDAWKTQAGYRTFASAARWILDSADPANYAATLATHKFLIQKVVDDKVVPNVATDALAKLSGLTSQDASVATGAQLPPPASTAITAAPTMSHWVTYKNLPPDAGSGFPGNTYQHASLLAPANTNNDGILGMLQVQVDAITFLFLNL